MGGTTVVVRACLAALSCWVLGGCGATGSSSDEDCESSYESVADGATWGDLEDAMLDYDGQGRVVSVRTQARGRDVGAGDEDAVRVVDLLDRRGSRVLQVEVWRTEAGAWRAGAWRQCID
ncbi:hypothetical protein [Nocardioides dongxiaopingii]|uniref:hypothetical protein n=1 Tax=Nocardioides dongxiaopingii TaxID=2576036 RepID=UPI0010C76BAD|nr:hypothetical protein [Nocardioides dongxiaopingii]